MMKSTFRIEIQFGEGGGGAKDKTYCNSTPLILYNKSIFVLRSAKKRNEMYFSSSTLEVFVPFLELLPER